MDENAAKNTERYQFYKLQWMLDHGHTLEEIFRELYMIQKEYLEDGESCPSIWTLLDRWEKDIGFGGECWACFVEKCAKYTMNEILEKKAEIMEYVRKDVTEYFAERGITITVLGMKDGIEYDDASVQAAINKSFVAERNDEAQEIENQTKISKANAEAEANKIISESLSDRLIQQQMYEKWDGKLPTYVGGDASIPVLNDMK